VTIMARSVRRSLPDGVSRLCSVRRMSAPFYSVGRLLHFGGGPRPFGHLRRSADRALSGTEQEITRYPAHPGGGDAACRCAHSPRRRRGLSRPSATTGNYWQLPATLRSRSIRFVADLL
jgi:hypothetical protein